MLVLRSKIELHVLSAINGDIQVAQLDHTILGHLG